MSGPTDEARPRASRRNFLVAGAGLLATGAASGATVMEAKAALPSSPHGRSEPFWGAHQGGILTPAQSHSYFAAFDLVTGKRDDVVALLRSWTEAAARLAAGQPAQPLNQGLKPAVLPAAGANSSYGPTGTSPSDDYGTASSSDTPTDAGTPAADTGEAMGLPPARLTLTFGFGTGLFVKDGHDRYGLVSRRPAALIDLPHFAGDQLVDAQSGGDLSVQACADDPQVAFHAVRQLARLAQGVARLRWVQTGFVPTREGQGTPRNLMGFKDGTNNPSANDAKAMAQFVWVDSEGPGWMRNGSYLVARRIRIALEHWDNMKLAFQEQTVGRHKYSGAPLGGKSEFTPLDLDASDKDGNPIIADNAHVRLAAAATNDGAQILRRPYSYNNGANITAERWPPWRQGLEYDAGLFFVCYQRDPRTGFIKIFERLSKLDMMNQFVTHVGGGLFACPGGVVPGHFIGQDLFET